jgi:hypothetical protein
MLSAVGGGCLATGFLTYALLFLLSRTRVEQRSIGGVVIMRAAVHENVLFSSHGSPPVIDPASHVNHLSGARGMSSERVI